MKKKKRNKSVMLRRVLGFGLSLVMIAGLAACGQNGGSTEEQENAVNETVETLQQNEQEKEPVTLEWYYRGNGIQKDTQLVEDTLNEYLKSYEGLEHVTVHMNCFSAADYANGVLLDQTSGKQIDILNTVGLDFPTEVKNGTYLALDDYLVKLPELQNELPEWLWNLGKVDEKIYMVPNYQRGANMMYITLPAVYEKYLDVDKFRELLQDKDTPVEELAAMLEEFIIALRKGEGTDTKYLPSLAGLYIANYGFDKYFDTINGSFVLYYDSTQVQNIYLTEQFKKACEITADWYDKGYIPQDILVTDMNNYIKANMLNDVSLAINSDQWYGDEEYASEVVSAGYGFDALAIPFSKNYFMANSWGAGGNGITASCEHPEEALKFIEALTVEKGKDIYNLIVYGIEGTHYEKLGDNRIKTLEYDTSQGGLDTSYAAMKWIIGNTAHAYLNQACSDDELEVADQINNDPNNIISPIMGFRVSTEAVATELEQIAAVVTEYRDSLTTGAMGKNWESTYNEFVQKLETAGCSKVIEEFQSQIDEFLK